MNNGNNMDMAKLMSILSKMDKKDLEAGIAKASKILNSKDKETIINEIKNPPMIYDSKMCIKRPNI